MGVPSGHCLSRYGGFPWRSRCNPCSRWAGMPLGPGQAALSALLPPGLASVNPQRVQKASWWRNCNSCPAPNGWPGHFPRWRLARHLDLARQSLQVTPKGEPTGLWPWWRRCSRALLLSGTAGGRLVFVKQLCSRTYLAAARRRWRTSLPVSSWSRIMGGRSAEKKIRVF